MIIEAVGIYDRPLHARLLPMMEKYKVTAYIQGKNFEVQKPKP